MSESSPISLEDEALEALKRNDGAKALDLYKKLATLGSDIACYVIGDIYLHGQGGIPPEPFEAKKWYERAMSTTNAKLYQRAAIKLGYIYEAGCGVAIDNERAFSYYKKLEGTDHPQGLTRLGVMYSLGKGTEKDLAKAMSLYRRAAKLGHVFGRKNLGLLKIRKGNPLGLLIWLAAVVQGLFIGIFQPKSYRIKML